MGVDGGFHLGPPFFFTSKLGIKEERIGIEKKVQNYPHFFFHPSTFINKDILVIISLSFHFFILPTKHMRELNLFYLPTFLSLPHF